MGEYQSTGNVNTGMEKRSGPVEVEICQPSIHTLKIIRRSLESTSRSFGEEFLYDCDGIVQIIYSYRSEPKATVRERSAISYGSARLMLDKVNSKKIEGDYWTDQKTTGTLSLVKKE